MDAHFDRVLAQPATRIEAPSAKRRSAGGSRDEVDRSKRRRDAPVAMSHEKIADLLAQADTNDIESLDERSLKTMAHALEKVIRNNALQRGKHSDEPTKFMDSELQLDVELSKWKVVAAAPALYPQLVQLGVVPLLLGLLAHENLDIRLDVINLLADLTDLDEDPSALAPTTALAEHLVRHKFLPVLVKTLDDLDQDAATVARKASSSGRNIVVEEVVENSTATGVFHALQTIENLVDVLPNVSSELSASTSIFSMLIRYMSPRREFSENKLYASEILSILLAAGRGSRDHFLGVKSTPSGEDLLDRLLQALAPYRKHDPHHEEEEEFLENVLNALCTVLLDKDGQDHFRRLEGVELMLRCMKDRKQYVYTGALRVLDHALMNNARNCERLVEVGGLKAVFPVFMGKRSAKKRENRVKEVENVTSIMASLCLHLHSDAKHDVHARFHVKYVEKDMEKMDRLVDLFVKYNDRVSAAASHDTADESDDEEEDIDDKYLRRLEAGLFVLQRVALIVAHMSMFSRKLHAYATIKLHERAVDIDDVKAVLREQLDVLVADARDEPTKASTSQQIDHLSELLIALENRSCYVPIGEDVNGISLGDAVKDTSGCTTELLSS